MPAKKFTPKKIAAATILVGAPIGAAVGVVYGTKDKVTERQDLPVVTFGDKYFNAVIKDDSSFAPSHVLSPEGGNNLYSSYVDLLSTNDIDHYTKIIKQKSKDDGGGPELPLVTKDIDITDTDSIEEIDQKFLDINQKLNSIASDYEKNHPGVSLGLATVPLIKNKKRVIQVAAYELEDNPNLKAATNSYFKSHLNFDVSNNEKSLTDYINKIDTKAGADGFDWSKGFMQILLAKTIANNQYFAGFGIDTVAPAGSKNEIKQYSLKYALLPNGKKVPVKYKDDNGEHFVITPVNGDAKAHPVLSALKDDSSRMIKLSEKKSDEFLFDGQLRNANGDYDFANSINLSENMIENNIVPQIESSIDWKSNDWFFKVTFNEVDSDSIISTGGTQDTVKNPAALSLKTIKVPLSHFGKSLSQTKDDSIINVANLKKFDNLEIKKINGLAADDDRKDDEEVNFNSNHELMAAVTKTINGLTDQDSLYELFRNAFLGKPSAEMDPQFSHYLKRNLISDGLGILGEVMPGILGPVDSFKTTIKMIDNQKANPEKIMVKGVEYQAGDFLRKVVFSNENIQKIFTAMEKKDSSTNGISFIYNSIIKFGIAEQRTPGVLSQGINNENGAKYILKSSNDWLWSSITKITALSATLSHDDYSLYNLYSLFSGLNIVDNIILKSFSDNGIKKTSEVDNGDSVISNLFEWADENKVLPKGTTIQTIISDVTGTIKKLVVNLYNENVLARDDEANGIPMAKRHKFVAFPSSIIEKVITLIPGVDWTKIKEKEVAEQKAGFIEFVEHASDETFVSELKGDALKEFATSELNTFNKDGVILPADLSSMVTNSISPDGTIESDNLRSFILKVSSGGYFEKLSLNGIFSLSSSLKSLYKIYDQTVLKGYLIPEKLTVIDPQEDVRKAAVSILGDPYTLISLIDTIKGNGIKIEDFMDKLIPSSSFDVSKMLPTLIETLTSKHNLDILTINRLLNVVSRMGLLPSIVDKILSPSVISTASSLIDEGKAAEIYKAFIKIYENGLYNYFNGATGLADFERDVEPIISTFRTKLKLIPEMQYQKLNDDAKKSAISDKQFEDAIFDILEHGLGDSTHKISNSLVLIGKVISNTLELPTSMIDIPKLIDAIVGVVEDGSIQSSLDTSIQNTDSKNPTAFQYLFDMLHDSGSTIIYNMLPDKLKTAMDAYPTKDLMQITQNLLYGFKDEQAFRNFLTFVKGLLPKDNNGKTILDKKLSELDDSVPHMVDIVTTDSLEELLVKAYNDEDLIKILWSGYGKDKISDPLSSILKGGIIGDPKSVSENINNLLHAKIKMGLGIYTLDIWKLLPENIKTMLSKVLNNLEDVITVAKNIIENPLNEITSDDVKKILDIVKIFVPDLGVSQDLVDGIIFLIHNGLNAGAGTSGPTGAIDASKEVDKILSAINSLVSIPDMIEPPIKNFMIGKGTFASLANDLADDIKDSLDNHPFAVIKHTAGEFDEIKNEIDRYNNLIDSIGTYRDMITDMPSLKATDPQVLLSYKKSISDLIDKLTKLETKTKSDIHDQLNGSKEIQKLFSDINNNLNKKLGTIDDSAPSLLTGLYLSLDGNQHKYSEFNTYEVAQWNAEKSKTASINNLPIDTLDKIKSVKEKLEKIYSDVQKTFKIPTDFNNGIQKALDAFTEYKVWLKDTSATGGAHEEARISDSGYDAIYNYFKDGIDKLKQSVTAANVLAQEQTVKDAVAKFNDLVKTHKAFSSDEIAAINKAFEGLSPDEIKGVFTSTSYTSQKDLFSKLSEDNKVKVFGNAPKEFLKILIPSLSSDFKVKLLSILKINDSKINAGLSGIDQNTLNQLKGKTIDWLFNNIKIGYDSGAHHWLGIDLFRMNEGSSGNGEVRDMKFSLLKDFKYQTGWIFKDTWTIKDVDGSSSHSPDFDRIFVLKGDNKGYNVLSGAHHELLSFLQHVYSKDFNWLIDNGWI